MANLLGCFIRTSWEIRELFFDIRDTGLLTCIYIDDCSLRFECILEQVVYAIILLFKFHNFAE